MHLWIMVDRRVEKDRRQQEKVDDARREWGKYLMVQMNSFDSKNINPYGLWKIIKFF